MSLSSITGAPLPTGWKHKRLKFASQLRTDRSAGSADTGEYVGLEIIESWTGRFLPTENLQADSEPTSEPSSGTTSTFYRGDVLFGKLRPYLAKVWLADRDGVCTTELLPLQPAPEFEGAFLKYTLLNTEFITLVESSTFGAKMPRANWDFIGGIKVLVPPLETQRLISRAIDCETSQIEALVAEKERMLALLEEKRAALISRAVTRGLNPKAPTKPSGLDWLGDIPEYWRLMRVKFLIEELIQGSSPMASNSPAEEGELGILKLSAISRGQFRRNENKALRLSDDETHADSLKAGDVLISRSNTPLRVGDACAVPIDEPSLLIPDLVYRLRVNPSRILPEFLASYLISAWAESTKHY